MTGCAAGFPLQLPSQWHQALQASASVTGGFVAGQPGFNDAIALTLVMDDCSRSAGAAPIVVRLGPECALRGEWNESAQRAIDDQGFYRYGSFLLAAGQTCVLTIDQAPKTLQVTTAVGQAHDARTLDLAIGATVVGGPDAGRHVDLRLSAAPGGPPAVCAGG